MKNSLLGILALALLLGPAAPLSANGLQLSQDASRRGRTGLEVVYSGNRQKNFLIRKFDSPQDRLVVELFLQLDADFRFERGGGHDILQLKKSGQKKPVVSVKMFRASNGSRLKFQVRSGNGNKKIPGNLFLRPGRWTRVTIELTTASGPGESDGSLRIFLNNKEKHLEAGLDNNNQEVRSIQLGQVGKPPKDWFGELHIDELVIRKSP